ncbi:hypothetical protein Dimus_003448 [Dionaea muscipula]
MRGCRALFTEGDDGGAQSVSCSVVWAQLTRFNGLGVSHETLEIVIKQSSPDYAHLASKMGPEFLARLLSKHLEIVIIQKIPSIIALINKAIDEINVELDLIGRPVAADGGATRR